jgi:hypothetical protein
MVKYTIMKIDAQLRRLQLRISDDSGRLAVRLEPTPPIVVAAYGVALLLDRRAQYKGTDRRKHYSYRSRFGVCAHKACVNFFWHTGLGPNQRATAALLTKMRLPLHGMPIKSSKEF